MGDATTDDAAALEVHDIASGDDDAVGAAGLDVEGDPAPVGTPAAPRPRRLALETLVVAVVGWAYGAFVMRVWEMPLRLPWDTRSDATLISMMVKNMAERGWYLNQPRLGAPFGQQFYDFPHGGESIQFGVMKLFVLVTGDWGLSINLYFLAGFGVLAAVTFLVLRHLRFGPVPAGIAALVFAFMPYHFTHGEMHLWRSTYYSAPLAALLLVWSTQWRDRFLVDPSRRGTGSIRGNMRFGPVAAAVAVAVVIGGTETMTTGFTMCLLLGGAVVAAIRWREPARLVVAGALIAVMAVTFGVLSYPTLNFYRVHGTNEQAARRLVTESELYGIKISRLVTPQGGHRSEFLSDIGARSQEDSFVRSEGGQALGVLGTAGFLGACWGAVAGRRRRRSPDTRPSWDRSALWEQASSFTVLALLLGVIGGFSVIVAMAGFSQIRVWNRIMLIIAFFAMVTVLLWAETLVAWVRRRFTSPRPILGALAVGVLAFGLWDGIPAPRKPYDAVVAQHANDREFVARIDDLMPEGAAVLQLPIVEFPESEPVGRMLDYDHLRAFLADDGSLRWSYGSIKGRPDAAWQVRLRDEVGPVGALPALLAMGFEGIWLDTFGYADRPDPDAEARAIEAAVGVAPIVSGDGRFLFFDLRDFARRSNLSDEELRTAAADLFGVEPLVTS